MGPKSACSVSFPGSEPEWKKKKIQNPNPNYGQKRAPDKSVTIPQKHHPPWKIYKLNTNSHTRMSHTFRLRSLPTKTFFETTSTWLGSPSSEQPTARQMHPLPVLPSGWDRKLTGVVIRELVLHGARTQMSDCPVPPLMWSKGLHG